MFKVDEYVDIAKHTTFKIGGQFRYFIDLENKEYLPEVYKFAKEKNLPVFILGGGSNIVFSDGVFDAVVVKIEFLGFEIINDTDSYTDIKIGAGENWDSVVERTVEMNLSGIEAMSAIPGTAGGTPVQNVGAYGQEIKDTLLSVNVFDTKEMDFKNISNRDCNFSYRNSIFKNEAKGRYTIVSITLRLSKGIPTLPNYPGVKKYFLENNINNPTLLEIRKAIIEIRRNKLPDPKVVANVGSFFKNPIVEKNVALNLKELYPDMTSFDVDENHRKIPAGWLIENAGLKDKDFGSVSTYKHNALVLVNNGSATRADVIEAKDQIIKTVFDKFGITLETEPEFV
jgi:UDP-N-acetylmuramate dehydrogenase